MTDELETTPLFTFDIDVGPAIDLGRANTITRRFVPILGGSVSGRFDGTILPGGGDWQSVSENGATEIAARYILSCADGLVEIESTGLRAGPPDVLERLARGEAVSKHDYYFRTAIRFHTGAPALADLNALLAIGKGERLAGKVRLQVFAVR